MLLPTIGDYILFSHALRRFMNIDHILGHKVSLNKFQGLE